MEGNQIGEFQKMKRNLKEGHIKVKRIQYGIYGKIIVSTKFSNVKDTKTMSNFWLEKL